MVLPMKPGKTYLVGPRAVADGPLTIFKCMRGGALHVRLEARVECVLVGVFVRDPEFSAHGLGVKELFVLALHRSLC